VNEAGQESNGGSMLVPRGHRPPKSCLAPQKLLSHVLVL